MKAETSVSIQLRALAVCRPKEYVTTTRLAYRSCGSYPAIPLTFSAARRRWRYLIESRHCPSAVTLTSLGQASYGRGSLQYDIICATSFSIFCPSLRLYHAGLIQPSTLRRVTDNRESCLRVVKTVLRFSVGSSHRFQVCNWNGIIPCPQMTAAEQESVAEALKQACAKDSRGAAMTIPRQA